MHNILIAEDDLIFLKLLTSGLRKFEDKFHFISAQNGLDAIEILYEKPISLLITDIQMPKVDGLELLAFVKRRHPVMPCIVMTAHKFDNSLLDDAVHVFTKPLDPKKVGRVIVQVLERDIPLGSVYGISLAGFLTMIEMERRTCLLEVNLPNKEKGFFYFDKGILYDVVCGGLKKEEAAMKLINEEKADFRFKYFSEKNVAKQVKMNLSSLIQEAKRRKIGLAPKKTTDKH